jgi:hemolysin activation/secretion protein
MSASVSGQWASDPLLAYEEFQIGNFTVGRGYDPGSASGDEAWAVQLEAGWPVDTPAGKIEPYVFYDYADLNNLDQSGYQTQISSYGVGVRARLPWKLRLDVAWASPQDPPFPSAPQPDDRLLVSLTRVFSFR